MPKIELDVIWYIKVWVADEEIGISSSYVPQTGLWQWVF